MFTITTAEFQQQHWRHTNALAQLQRPTNAEQHTTLAASATAIATAATSVDNSTRIITTITC